jgi:adenine-specific DNA glycosylase
LARLFGIAGDPKAKPVNARLWRLAEELAVSAPQVTALIST